MAIFIFVNLKDTDVYILQHWNLS